MNDISTMGKITTISNITIDNLTFESYIVALRRCYDFVSKTCSDLSTRNFQRETYERYIDLNRRITSTTFPNKFYNSQFLARKVKMITAQMINFLTVTTHEWDRWRSARKLDELFETNLFVDSLDRSTSAITTR